MSSDSIDRAYRQIRAASEQQHGRGTLSLVPNYKYLTEALAADLVASGVEESAIKFDERATETAGYRIGAQRWDLVLVRNGIPAAVIEWKVLRHGRNLSNRLDEIIAAATNLRVSFEGVDAAIYRPSLAVVFLVDMDLTADHGRLELLADRLRKMVGDQLLDAACAMGFDPVQQRFSAISEDLDFDQFASRISSRMLVPPARTAQSLGAAELGRLLSMGDVAGLVTGLASTSAGLSAVEAAVIATRRRIVSELQALAVAEGTTETMMHQAIGDNYWIFGGQYVGIAPRSDLALLDRHDYMLLCADDSVQIIELKGPDSVLTRRHRNHLIVTNEVHEATSQCLNYLRSLDEQGPTLQTTYHNELGLDIDFRRARGTVVIGHPDRRDASIASKAQTVQTIRSYNAHLARIQVVTYADLLEAADRALRFEAEPN
jgi:hypothetical protein